MDNFRVYKTVHFPDEWAKQITEAHHKENNTTKGTYMYYNVVNMNQDPKHYFYILGLLNDRVIASCFVNPYLNFQNDERIDNYDEFLISYLIVDKDYQKQGYGTKFIDSVIKILKEENATKICAFACDNSKKLFENFGFTKDENKKTFGTSVPGDDNDVYYELKLESNFFLAPLNDADAWTVALSKNTKLGEIIKQYNDFPFYLLPSANMYKNDLLTCEKFDNALIKIVRCNKMAVGYTYMYYHDYETPWGYKEHQVIVTFYLDDNYLYRSAMKVIIDEAVNFFYKTKENYNVEFIEVVLSKYTILMEQYKFYRRCLLELGFVQKDNELFVLKNDNIPVIS